jgi:FkbM family methyltransferase
MKRLTEARPLRRMTAAAPYNVTGQKPEETAMRAITATRVVFCFFLFAAHSSAQENGRPQKLGQPTLIRADAGNGLELWQTALGPLWIPRPGADVIRHLQWEQTEQKVYNHPQAHVLKGDIVVDAGAHIGGFARVALQSGAGMVIAIEPEAANILAFQKNFPDEIRSGRVKLVTKGLWDQPGKLPLHVSSSGDSHSVVVAQSGGKEETIELVTLDDLVTSLKLTRIDFIKMDIEGAEKKALQGARQTLSRFHPRLALSSYHEAGDPAAICDLVWKAWPGYLVAAKDLFQVQPGKAVPKVLFFHPGR